MKYHCELQLDATDCAAACLSTICKQYGIRKHITKIRELAGTDKNGTNGIGVIKAATALGFQACGVEIEEKSLLLNEISFPCIAHVMKNGLNHYVVIHHVTDKTVLVADPAEGLITYKHDSFRELWTGILFLLEPTKKLKNLDNDRNIVFGMLDILKSKKKLLSSVIITSLFYTVLGIGSTLFFRIIFDHIIPQNNIQRLSLFAIGFTCCHLLKGFIQFIRVKLILILSKNLDMELTFKSYEHIIELPMNFFSMRQTGEIISRLNDASKIRDALSGVTVSTAVDTIMAIFCGILLFTYNRKLFLITIIILLLIGIINLTFVKKIKQKNTEVLENGAKVNAMFIESIKGIETIKAHGAEKEIEKKSRTIFTKLLDSSFSSQQIHTILSCITGTLCSIGYVLVLWIGSIDVLNGLLTIGTLLSFYSLIGYFLTPVQSILGLQVELQGALVAMQRLDQLLGAETEDKKVNDGNRLSEKLGDIKLDHVSFRYGTRNLILNNICCEIKKNEKIAIVGESGSGKTTLARLLLGFYQYESGEIYFNQTALTELNKEWLRNKISYVSQEPYFFKGTLKENLLFGNSQTYSDKEIDMVLETVQLKHFIKNAPDGLNMKLQENAHNLSGGQRQRLCLARAILRHPDILILDEATSNLDVITESAITKAIQNFQNQTTIIIAHRLSTIKKCDRIIVLKNGAIEEIGPHDELMGKKGYYFDLWKEQQ